MQPDFSIRDVEVYLDNAATTVIDEEVVGAMVPYLEERYGNPETPYYLGREAQEAVDDARAQVSELLGCLDDEVYFTSGGTESNNWAVKSLLHDKAQILVGAAEHSSVLEAAKWAASSRGIKLHEVAVDSEGVVDVGFIEHMAETGNVGLVSIQHSNNEVGTLQPVDEISAICAKHKVPFHCDACQSFGKVPLDVDEEGYDMVSLSAHKIHGPMGIGALYVRPGVSIEPLLHGGSHERGRRAGTLAVPQIVGFGKAAELAYRAMKKDMPRVFKMVDELAHELGVKCDAVRNGSPKKRLPNILNVSLPGVDASLLVGVLAKHGICISTGSACRTKQAASPVLRAMGKDRASCESAIRVSLSRYTTEADIAHFVAKLQTSLKELPQRGTM